MKNYSKPVSILAKIAEIALWVGAVLCLIAIIFTFTLGEIPEFLIEVTSDHLDILGLSVQGEFRLLETLRLLLVYGVIGMAMHAMIARNIYLISRGLSKDSQLSSSNTPFTLDNARMVREIGIFSLITVAAGLIMSCICTMINSGLSVDVSMDVSGIFAGLVILYLSWIFSYGIQLQEDVDGLV